jgi:ADP-ribose pyrophosphatase YjhB (NUDIX family)
MNADELVDLVDGAGLVKLRGIRRGEVKERKQEFLVRGLYQPIVIVVVIDHDDNVIAQVRGDAKADDGRGAVDHVCGVIAAGETWEQAARREAAEEINVELDDLMLVDQSVNGYGRHRTLAVARAVGEPQIIDSNEVARIFHASRGELKAMAQAETQFIGGFFSDLELALAHLGATS